jgi:hypothetical protein
LIWDPFDFTDLLIFYLFFDFLISWVVFFQRFYWFFHTKLRYYFWFLMIFNVLNYALKHWLFSLLWIGFQRFSWLGFIEMRFEPRKVGGVWLGNLLIVCWWKFSEDGAFGWNSGDLNLQIWRFASLLKFHGY